MNRLGHNLSFTEVDQMILEFDRNDDNCIDFNEFLSLMQIKINLYDQKEAIKEAFKVSLKFIIKSIVKKC